MTEPEHIDLLLKILAILYIFVSPIIGIRINCPNWTSTFKFVAILIGGITGCIVWLISIAYVFPGCM